MDALRGLEAGQVLLFKEMLSIHGLLLMFISYILVKDVVKAIWRFAQWVKK